MGETEADRHEPSFLRRVAAGAAGLAGSAARASADLIVPPVCLGCHRAIAGHDALCAVCWSTIAFIRPPLCDRLGIPLPFDTGGIMISAAASARPPVYGRARAVARFDGVLQELVHGFKYADRHDARRLFGRWMAHAGRELLDGADMLVPVPLNRWRLLSRRFNQSAILAQEVARVSGVRFAPAVVERRKRTPPQVRLTHDERRRNVAGAFAVPERHRPDVANRAIVLVDDVVTTGATVEACARALLLAGAARVDVLALALVTGGEGVST